MDSPFNRSDRTVRTPPPTPTPGVAPAAPHPQSSSHSDAVPKVVSTSEIQNWMSSIEQWLNEVCTIASEGKLNSEQKLRINSLCRKVGHGTSQMAVQYQSLKMKAVQGHALINTLQDQLDLAQDLKDIKLTIEESAKPSSGASFADMVKKGSNNFIQPMNLNSVAIYPNDKLRSSEETKTLVQKIICPEQMKLHVRGLRKTRNGGVIISTDTKDDIVKLKQSVQLTNSGLTVDEPYKRNPRVVIIGVPSAMQEKEVLACLYHQNLADKLQDSTLETFLTSIKLSHKSGKKDAVSCNYIIEVSAAVRKALITNERIFVNWSSCPVRDFTLVTRCYNCQQYGHAAKSCRQTTATCGHCGDQGHSIKECPRKAEEPKCATCLHFKKPSKHTTGSFECPAKLMAEKRSEQRPQREDAGTSVSDEQMKSGAPRYPVDRYLVESSKKFEMVNIIDDEIWHSEPALRPEDEIILRKLHEMLQSTADDLKLLSGELSKFHEPGVQVKSAPTPLDEEFNEKVHIEEVVNAKFHGYKIVERHAPIPVVKQQNDTIDEVKNNRITKVLNTGIDTKASPLSKRPVVNRNLRISRTRIMQINGKDQDSVKNEKLNNGKVINSAPAVAYSEFSYKYVEPKVRQCSRKVLQVQDMPSINIRSEFKEQKVLQLDIVPENTEGKEINTARSNVSVVTLTHNLPEQVHVKSHESVKCQKTSTNNQILRKISKMSTCESSGSTYNADSDARVKQNTQKRIISAMRNSPKTSLRDRVKKTTMVKKETDKRPSRLNVDEWKRKLNVVYGASSSKKNKVIFKKSPKKPNVTKNPITLNSTEYVPYSHLTLGGVRVSDIEKELTDLPYYTDMPLSPILDKILSSRENSFLKESSKTPNQKDGANILTTSDENLLQEVIDIERSVSETLSKNLKKKINEPVVKSQNNSGEGTNGAEENDSYADDFEDEKSDHSEKSNNRLLSIDDNPEKSSVKLKFKEEDNVSSENDNDEVSYSEPPPGPSNIKDTTYSKAAYLSFKDSVDIFEFVHSVETQDTGTQSDGANKIIPQETQTSPPYDRPNIQPIHNDLWPSVDPRREVEKMFQLEKDFIKRLIIDEYGDLLEKNINKPSTSNENKQEEIQKNVIASQKNTQTSPAHVKSVMTSPRNTKTRTTSPFHLSVPVQQQTSPMIFVTKEEEQGFDVEIEADDISINLSSPRFSLRLPQNSREVLSNLDHSRSNTKVNLKNEKLNNKTFTKISISSSSSVDADNSSSEMSSLGEVKIKRKQRKKVLSISEYSSSSTVSKYSYNLQCTGVLPLRSEGEVSLGQAPRKRLQKPTKSDGETSMVL